MGIIVNSYMFFSKEFNQYLFYFQHIRILFFDSATAPWHAGCAPAVSSSVDSYAWDFTPDNLTHALSMRERP
jgi:hypothetical protein